MLKQKKLNNKLHFLKLGHNKLGKPAFVSLTQDKIEKSPTLLPPGGCKLTGTVTNM